MLWLGREAVNRGVRDQLCGAIDPSRTDANCTSVMPRDCGALPAGRLTDHGLRCLSAHRPRSLIQRKKCARRGRDLRRPRPALEAQGLECSSTIRSAIITRLANASNAAA